MNRPPKTQEWKALAAHFEKVRTRSLRELFEEEPDRVERMTWEVGDLWLDLSKNRVTRETMRLLLDLAVTSGLSRFRKDMFRGERINRTEDRAVLHTALRHPLEPPVYFDGVDVMPGVHRVLQRMSDFCRQIHSGDKRGFTGKRFQAVVNIGIGGSDLGPRMAVQALKPYHLPGIEFRFVSNIDPSNLTDVLHNLSPEETLFVVCSKSFRTEETLKNARSARSWVLDRLGDPASVSEHFVAVSSNQAEVTEFGIARENMFEFWDWVGGRYSLTSAIGLSIMLAIGSTRFRELLDGFHQMDRHFLETPFERNAPVILGLLGLWYNNFFGCQSKAIIPYDHRLSGLPAYLQQTDMESNGKSVSQQGEPVSWQTGPLVWGEPGTNGQHAFFQLLHQGTRLVPVDLIAFAESHNEIGDQQESLIANALAQAEALAFGRTAVEAQQEGMDPSQIPFRVFPGNRPTNVILAPRLTPGVLGQLVALYEHQVFTQGFLWNIYSFDQWGVELGKTLASRILAEVTAESLPELAHDSSTNQLIQRVRALRGRS